ncbi:alkaline shock response membrane anchor protein AmaP [Oceanivirga miroungae]|uniref:Alkaline shock response membrane anchor protein AmaP n=1 Tax=Oceanivirga miroungae TaxID=1130046 RepID=A0A6I8MDN1_9FUSO|nr:alkaline shock response membrane anchor protein AmaP [Oceanivirga miroungae]VWL85616.1 hypothetical protein OMES3154_00901 [Oceanivirga miroungae]
MFKFLNYLISLVAKILFLILMIYLIIDPSKVKEILEVLLSNFDNNLYHIIAIVLLALYFIIYLLSMTEGLFKKKKTILSNTKNGKIEVNFKTLENIIKNFLEVKDIIKTVKVNIIPTRKTPDINIDIECYKTQNLNEKLDKIKVELEEHLEKMIGVKPKKISLKVVMISDELAIEEIQEKEFVGEN